MAHALALRNTQKPPSTNGPETWTYHFCSQCLLINESSKNGGYKNNCKFGMSWDEDYPGFAE